MAIKEIKLKHFPFFAQVVNILTKAISSSRFLLLRDKLRVEQKSTLSLKGAVRR